MSDKFRRLLKKKIHAPTQKAKSLDSGKDDINDERDTALLVTNCEPIAQGKFDLFNA